MGHITELEERLQFQYLVRNGFETDQDRLDIEAKGLEKLRRGAVAEEAIALGMRFAREIREGYLPKASVIFVSDRVGHGLFVEEAIQEGNFVGEYTGIVRKNNRHYLEPLNDYCCEYPIQDNIGRSFVIDATKGNLTRFINHSSNPNLKSVYAFLDGFYHCIFLAICPISKDSQLSYDYGKNYWYIRGAPESN